MEKRMQTFYFLPAINLVEEGKWLLRVTSFECKNSVFIKTNKNNSFLIIVPNHWQTESADKTINGLIKLKEPKSQNSIELHVKEVKERGNEMKIRHNEHKFLDFDTQKTDEILEELKNAKNVDLNSIPAKRTGYSLIPGIYEVVYLNNTFKKTSPDNVKVNVTNDDKD